MELKKGDRVKCVKEYRIVKLGMLGTIINPDLGAHPSVGVEWDEDIGGHGGGGYYSGKSGHCWNVEKENITLVSVPQKILITTDGTTTLARLYNGEKVVKSAEAKCAPCDTYDFAIGAGLAFDRLMGHELPYREVKRAAQVGETVMATVNEKCITKGEKYEVIAKDKADDGFIYVRTKSRTGYDGSQSNKIIQQPFSYLAPDEYVVLEGYRP